MAQASHIIQCLLSDVFRERVRHIIYIAGVHQILPYDQSVFVAQIVKRIVRIIAAAPDTQAVEVRADAGSHEIFLPLFCDPRITAVFRNIISTLCKDLHAVYDKGKLLPPPVFLLTNRERPNPDPLFDHITHTAVLRQQFHRHRVKILFSVSVRPPFFRMLQQKSCPAVSIRRDLRIDLTFHRNADARSVLCRSVKFCLHIEPYALRLVLLSDMYIIQLCPAVRFEINIAEDPRIDQLWAPVPAKHGMRFADQFISLHRAAGNIPDLAVFPVRIIFNKFKHGAKFDPDPVGSAHQHRLYRDFPCTVHIVRRKHLCVIDVYIRKRIESLADEKDLFLREKLFLHLKFPDKFIVFPE